MPVVTIAGAAGLRYTRGLAELRVEATTVRRLIAELDARFPGLGREVDDAMAIAINGEIHQDHYAAVLPEDAEICLIPKIAGG
jgi:molybdopterin converting factor small subunit